MSKHETRELDESRQRIYALCKQEMRAVFRECPYSTMSDSIVFLATPERNMDFLPRLRAVVEIVRKKVRSWTGFTLTVGCGDEKPDFMGCEESYEEARKAIEMMQYRRDSAHRQGHRRSRVPGCRPCGFQGIGAGRQKSPCPAQAGAFLQLGRAH